MCVVGVQCAAFSLHVAGTGVGTREAKNTYAAMPMPNLVQDQVYMTWISTLILYIITLSQHKYVTSRLG